jgi:hypothetical protein
MAGIWHAGAHCGAAAHPPPQLVASAALSTEEASNDNMASPFEK